MKGQINPRAWRRVAPVTRLAPLVQSVLKNVGESMDGFVEWLSPSGDILQPYLPVNSP